VGAPAETLRVAIRRVAIRAPTQLPKPAPCSKPH
jgi:hypothetical protein